MTNTSIEQRPPVRAGGRPVLGIKRKPVAQAPAPEPAIPKPNKKQRRAAFAAANDLLGELVQVHPESFCSPPKPLEIGIFKMLRAAHPGHLYRVIHKALRLWTLRSEYLACCKEGAPRVDLDGNQAGSVTAAQDKWAANELNARSAHRQSGGHHGVVQSYFARVGK